MDGDLITGDYQYEFRGLVFGSGTPIVVETMEGLLSMAEIAANDFDNASGHGTFPGQDRLKSRQWTGSLRPTGTAGAGIEGVLLAMERSFQSTRYETPFVFKRPGRTKRRIYARCRRRDIPTSYELAHGIGEATVEWYATDPRVYSNSEDTESDTFAIGENQITFEVHMGGTFEYGTFPIIEIDGPANDLVIANDADENKQIMLDYNLGAGDTMVIDVKARTVQVDGVDVYGPGVVLPGTRWWSLLPGTNPITVIRQNTGAEATVRVRWRDAWS